MSTVKISEYTGDISGRSGSFDYISVTGGITASNLFLDDNTLYLGSTPFSKSDIDNLKSGKPIVTDSENMLVSAKDANTKIRTSTAGRMAFYAGGTASIDIKSDKVVIGGIDGGLGGIPVVIPSNLTVTGSTTISGSTNITGEVNILPPPVTVTEPAIVDTTYWRYSTASIGDLPPYGSGTPATGAAWFISNYGWNEADIVVVEGETYIKPQALNQMRFSLNSQLAYNQETPTIIPVSHSLMQMRDNFTDWTIDNPRGMYVTFTPSYPDDEFPLFSYKWEITGLGASGPTVAGGGGSSPSHYTFISLTNGFGGTTFIESSSIDPNQAAPSNIKVPTNPDGHLNGKFTFEVEGAASGGYNLGNLLTLLANYGQTGIPTGSLGDFNFDGSVNIHDLLLLTAGFSNPNVIVNDTYLTPNTNHQFTGPILSISSGVTLIIPEGTYCSIT